jgi:hypothetical protein
MMAPQPLEHPLLFPVADTSLDLQEIEDLDLVSDDENFNFEPVQIPDDPPLDSESDGPAPDSGADRQLQQTNIPSLAGSTAPDVPRFVPIEPRRSTITGTVFSARPAWRSISIETVKIEKLRISLQFIVALESACKENSQLTPGYDERLWNPPCTLLDTSDPGLRQALKTFTGADAPVTEETFNAF